MSLIMHLEQLRITQERAQNLHKRITVCADAFTGSHPTEPERDRDRISGHSLNNQFGEIISDLQTTLEAMRLEIERIEEQVLDLGAPTKGPANFRSSPVGSGLRAAGDVSVTDRY